MLAERAGGGVEQQVARRGEPQVSQAPEADADEPRVRAGRHDEVVFQPAAVAVVFEIDARVDGGGPDTGKVTQAGEPVFRIGAAEIVSAAGQRVGAGQYGRSLGAGEPQLDRSGLPANSEHGAAGDEEDPLARSARQVTDLGSGLSVVCFESERRRGGRRYKSHQAEDEKSHGRVLSIGLG